MSSAFHWFDRTLFLREANRLLPVGHWLVLYENHFKGCRTEASAAFDDWFRSRYLVQFPSPPRNAQPLTDTEAKVAHFRLVHTRLYSNDVIFTQENLARYLTTQSNVIAAVEEGTWTIGDVCEWLRSSLEPFFRMQHATFEFSGSICFLQKERATA